MRSTSGRLRFLLAVLVGLPPAVARAGGAAPCHSTCAQALVGCKRTCPGAGRARRECRTACAERSACAAPGARIRTLSYVVTACSTDSEGVSSVGQKLVIRRGNCDPVTVVDFPVSTVGRQRPDLFRRYGALRLGDWAVQFGVFQRTAVLPDGSGVVFEVTNDLSGFPASTPELPEKEKGIFFVRADGKDGPRRLGPGTRVRTFVPFLPGYLGFDLAELFFGVSPDGRTLAFTDLGPGPDPDARETIQIWTLDIASRRRTQVTHLREVGEPGRTWTCCPSFLDNGTLSFQQRRYFVEADFHYDLSLFTVRTDGSNLKEMRPSVAIPGSRVFSQFAVTGSGRKAAVSVVLPGTSVVRFPLLPFYFVEELFLVDGKNLLQLTNFGRSDTTKGNGGALAGQRVFFYASANPFGSNPGENCQIFSVNALGGNLHQLTRLRDGGRSSVGCFYAQPGSACSIQQVKVNPLTRAVGFTSSCDPVGRNPFGYQAFSMRPDGSGLRQLTSARGLEIAPDGTVHVELPGPIYFQ